MKMVVSILIFIIFASHAMVLCAAEPEQEYTAHDKFARGIFNLVTFLFEVPITVHEVSVNENPVMGLLYGLPLGIGKSIVRLLVGVVEAATAPMPPYKPVLEPEYLLISTSGEKMDRD